MNICPQCGCAFTEETKLSAPREVECARCSWVGNFNETVYVDDLAAGVKTAQIQLEVLYKRLSSEASPHIGKILLETGMILAPDNKDTEEDKKRIRLLAKVLEGAVRGAVGGIAKVVTKEMGDGGN